MKGLLQLDVGQVGNLRLIGGLLLAALAALPQANVGRISGTVQDSSGGVMAGCTVTITSTAMGLKLVEHTGSEGSFVFPSLAAGAYDVRVEKTGFKSAEETRVMLDAASARSLAFTLDVGDIAESVQVTAGLEQVDTASGSVGKVINQRQLSQIAMNGREFTQLLRLAPGVAATTLNVFNPQLVTNQQAIDGVRAASAYFLIDGAENMNTGANSNMLVDPNVDAIAEVKMDMASYAAEFGGRGGAMINVVTKSGTRELHGTLFEFVRNNHFDARSFFDQTRQLLHCNDFGGTLGGPIFVPHGFNHAKDKLFFFFSQEWKYTRIGQTMVNVVPTAAERAGNFQSSTLAAPIDPAGGQPFPNRLVPVSRWSHNGPLLLPPIELPNFSGPGGNFAGSGVARTDYREELGRIDYYLNPKNLLSYRLNVDQWDIVFPFRNNTLPFLPNPRDRPGYLDSIGLETIFSPATLNYFSFSVNHERIDGHPDLTPLLRSTLGVTFPTVYPMALKRAAMTPDLVISGFAGYTGGDRIQHGNANFQVRDDFTKVRGSHTLKFGVLTMRARQNEDTSSGNTPDQGVATFNASALNSTRNVLADVLLGNFQNYTEAESISYFWSRYWQLEMYAQDKWKASRRLTIDAGLRYNIIPWPYNAQGNASTFLPRLFNPANAPRIDRTTGAITPGSGDPYNGIAILGAGLPSSEAPINWNNWGPRAGLAYDVFGDGRMAVRSGFGIFYDRGPANLGAFAENPPFVNVANIFNGNIDNPAGGTATRFPSNLNALPERMPTPSVMSYNLGIQWNLPASIILDAAYVGNLARHLQFTRNINQLEPGTLLATTANINALRPYQGYGDIILRDLSDTSNYNSLQMSLSRRLARGFFLGASYTFSKTMDKVGGATPQNTYQPSLDAALADIHRSQILTVNYIYELPFARRGGSAAARVMLGGWQLAGVTSFQSGAPNSVTVPVDIARIGAASSRASVSGDPDLAPDRRTPAHWFNAAAFVNPAAMTPGQFGNTGRNILIGPGFENWDLALIKNFTARHERARLQFRAESFNIFNHANFTGINTTVQFDANGNPAKGFGAVNAAGPGRVLSFGLKVLF